MRRVAQVAVFVLSGSLASAAITSPQMAEQAVRGWLNADPQPLGMVFQNVIDRVETFANDTAEPIYYIVYLQPAGFVVVSADDLIEPIIAFVEDGVYDPSPDNPLGALVSKDLGGRAAAVRAPAPPKALGNMQETSPSQDKWAQLAAWAERPEDEAPPDKGLGSVSDVRRAALVQSKWGQGNNFLSHCYNTYTPNNYPCGCVATAMAQVMRYFQYPASGVGIHPFTIRVDGVEQTRNTRGGNGQGGPYNWGDMTLDPDFWTGESQRNAIGALCYDAGLSVNMKYTSGGSSASADSPKYALTKTFGYRNAVVGINGWSDIGPPLVAMVNPNLDALSPVLLSISRSGGAHAIVCDGYGYNASTPYHHLNMGWEGEGDAWYNLPNIDSPNHSYTVVDACIYNIRPTGTGDGEIISGRVLYPNGTPVPAVWVYAVSGSSCHLAATDGKGIYAFSDLKSGTQYWLTAGVRGFVYHEAVETGTSKDNEPTSGNRWGVDVTLARPTCWYVDDDAPPDPTGPPNFEDGSAKRPFNSIQEAIDLAANGDTVVVSPGTYREGVNFLGKAITLRSSEPTDPAVVAATVIDGSGTRYHVVQCINHEGANTVLDGFTITGGNANGTWPNDCGGGMYNERSGPTIRNCIFSNNRASSVGGGMYNHVYNDQQYGNPTIINCTFRDNVATKGGGICSDWYVNAQVVNCTFSGNSAESYGGGMYNDNSSMPALTNCVFSQNTAQGASGGGIANYNGSHCTLTGCTVYGNSSPSAVGGGIRNWDSSPTLTNCIVWGNDPDEISSDGTSRPVVVYCDVEGGMGQPWFGVGCIDADPLFVDGPGGNLRLSGASPCVDAGDTMAVSTPLDVDGASRAADYPGVPNTGRSAFDSVHVVDMGAYELQCRGVDGDNNCDGRTDLKDFCILAESWLAGARQEP